MRDLFLELIKVAIGKVERLSVTPTAEQWQGLLEEAQRQTLCGVLFPAIESLPSEQRPPKAVLLSWYSAKELIAHTNETVNKDCIWVSNKFHQAGFRNIILKGQGNALLYPNPALRQPGDIDIWLEGKRKQIITYVHRFFPKQPVQWIEVEFPIKRETTVEVHMSPSYMSAPLDNQRLQKFFMAHQEEMFQHKVKLGDGEISTPTLEVNLVFQLSHIYRHLFSEGIGLRQLMDYYYLLHCEGCKELFPKVMQTIKSLHMERFCHALMWVLKEVFLLEDELMPCTPDEQEGRFLLQEIMLAGNFGHYDERNVRKTSKWGNFWQITLRNWRFFTHYPREVFWNPFYRIWQYAWRIKNGYK